MKFKIFGAMLALLFLVGCYGYSEPNSMYMVTSLGVESDSDGRRLSLQAVDITEKENSESPKTFTVSGKGESFDAALQDAETKLSKKASLKHCELIIIATDMLGSDIKELLAFCGEKEISFQTRLACSERVDLILENDGISAGTELISLIKKNSTAAGFGGHTALYEIETALVTNGGDFALPILSLEDEVAVIGLQVYESLNPSKILGYEESIQYAKWKKLYQGEK